MSDLNDQEGDRRGLPLSGLKVIEFCTTIAGPACTRLLADFGADVIKIEPPEGDPVRQMSYQVEGTSSYTPSLLRGKRSMVLDLKRPECVEIAAALIERSDIVVENFRPGVLERLGLGYEAMSRRNYGLIMVRISGYGQDGPYASRPGYGVICEAVGGVRNLTGDPDRPPARVALPTTDYLSAVYAAYGTMVAVHERARSGRGQVVDLALYEAAFSQMEMIVPAHEKLGIVPQREGSNLPGAVPNSLYSTSDGSFVLIAANNEATWRRLAGLMAIPGLEADTRFRTMADRGAPGHAEQLNEIIAGWTSKQDAQVLEQRLHEAEVPATRVYSIADIYADEHFRARDMLLKVPHPRLGHTTQIGIVPKLSATPGAVRSTGPEVGQHTRAILHELGMSDAAVAELELKAAGKKRVGGRT